MLRDYITELQQDIGVVFFLSLIRFKKIRVLNEVTNSTPKIVSIFYLLYQDFFYSNILSVIDPEIIDPFRVVSNIDCSGIFPGQSA